MLNNVYFQVSLVVTFILVLLLSVTKNDVLKSFNDKQKKQYNLVLLVAALAGAISFLITRSTTGAVISVVILTGVISIYEDETTKSVNRNMLRVGYLFTNIISYVIINNTPEMMSCKLFLIVYFVAFLIALLFFSGIGPSDARMFMLVCPLFVLLFKDDSLILLLTVIITCMMYQQYRQAISLESKAGVPMALPIYGTTFVLIMINVLDLILSSRFTL